MKSFYNLRIAYKLVSVFFIIIVFVLFLGSFAIIQVGKVNAASSDIASNWLPAVRSLSQIQLLMARIRGSEAQNILLVDPKKMEANRAGSEKLIVTLNALQETYQGQISGDEANALARDIKKTIENFLVVHRKIISLSMEGDKEAAQLVNVGSSDAYQGALASIEKSVVLNDTGAKESNLAADNTYSSARNGILVLVFVCMAAALLLSLWLARLISRPLQEGINVARHIADGDLRADIHATSRDETGQLMEALRSMNDGLRKIVADVRQGTDTITSASTQISSGTLDLSSRTEQQASALQETASAMEELTATVKQNAANARLASDLATSASGVAVSGGAVVGKVVATMGAINQSSRKIVDIISVIDGIAFQTNILALNAAVEAARAGEQGRGFAVVATEVRALAQRSANAAKEIKVLIDNSVAQIAQGSKNVEEAGSTMNEVVVSVKRVTDIVQEISLASQEQSTGIEQVNLAITSMDEMTQKNAALAEEATAAAQSMQAQASRLSDVVSIFKVSPDRVPAGIIALR